MRWLHVVALAAGLLVPVAARANGAPAAAPATSGVVNVATASAEELERLPGIGEKKAQAILDHRKTHPLHKLEDLTRVKGIGRRTVARLKPYLALSGPTTLTERPRRARQP